MAGFENSPDFSCGIKAVSANGRNSYSRKSMYAGILFCLFNRFFSSSSFCYVRFVLVRLALPEKWMLGVYSKCMKAY